MELTSFRRSPMTPSPFFSIKAFSLLWGTSELYLYFYCYTYYPVYKGSEVDLSLQGHLDGSAG